MSSRTTHPDQRAWLLEDLEGRMSGAVEEMVRWATPIMTFRRTAARDLEFRGQEVTAGDKLVMFYSSANRDAFAHRAAPRARPLPSPQPAHQLRGRRHPPLPGQPARRFQLRALFTELLTRAPHLAAGEPELMPGNFFHVVKRMPCSL